MSLAGAVAGFRSAFSLVLLLLAGAFGNGRPRQTECRSQAAASRRLVILFFALVATSTSSGSALAQLTAQAIDGSAHYGVIAVDGESLQFNNYGGRNVTPGDYIYGWSKNYGLAYQSTYLSSCASSSTVCHVKDSQSYCWTATKPANGSWSTIANITDSALATANSCLNGPNAFFTTQAVASTTLTAGTAATAFTPVTASGGTTPYTFAVSPSLPSGLAFSTSTGQITGTPTATQAATTHTVTATDSSSPTQTSSKTFGLTVNKAAQTISFPAIADTNYGKIYTDYTEGQHVLVLGTTGTSQLGLGAAASSGLALSFTTSGSCTYAAYLAGGAYGTIHRLTFTGVGTCSVTASQAGNASYDAATSVTRTFNIAKGDQTISYDAYAARTYSSGGTFTARSVAITGGAADYRVNNSSSQLTVSYVSATPSVCSVGSSTLNPYNAGPTYYYYSDATVTMLAPGTCTLTASQPGDANFNAAPNQSISIQINAIALTTTQAVASTTLTVGTAAASFTPVTASGGYGTLAYAVSPALPTGLSFNTTSGQITGTPTVASAATTYTVTVTDQTAPAQTSSKTFSLTVNKASQTISFTKPADATFVPGGTVALSATATSGLSVSFASTTTGVCTVSGTTATMVSVGTCSITASQAGDANYDAAANVSQSFSIGNVSQTITFTKPADVTFAPGGTVALSATATSGLPVSFASTTTGVCTVSGSTATMVAAGTCSITASQAGNASYSAAADVTQSFSIGKVGQIITFAKPSSIAFKAGATVALSATASSGLAVSFTSLTATVCAVSGSTVTFLAVGSCTIRASQVGDSSYAAAPDVSQTFGALSPPGVTATGTVEPSSFSTPGVTLVFTLTLKNGGGLTATGLKVTDERLADIGCASTSLPPGGEMKCQGTTVTTAADLEAGKISISPKITYTYAEVVP